MKIRPWEPEDEHALWPMVRDCLQVNFEAGADLQPTAANTGKLVTLGLSWAQRGEPTLVALLDGKVVAFTLWGSFENNLGLQMRDNFCVGLGTYVLPEQRHRGVASDLRTWAMRVALERGYARILGTAYHDAGLASVLALGFRAVGTQVEKQLQEVRSSPQS